MVLYNVPSGQLASGMKLRTPEQLNFCVKAESNTGSPGFYGAAQQHWQQNHGSIGQGQQPGGLAQIASPHRMEPFQQVGGLARMPSPRRMEQGQQASGRVRISSPHRHSPGLSGQSSPKLEHHDYGEREMGREAFLEAAYEEYSHDRKRCKVQDSFHTISSQMQSQLLTSRGPACSSGLALTRDNSVELHYGELSPTGNRGYSRMAPGPPITSSGPNVNSLDEASPLGLTLKKTPSLIDLISMKLASGGNGDQGGCSSPDSVATQDAEKNRSGKFLVPSVSAQDKLKASNFPANTLKIGTWERTSRYEGDLVGKCYYAKRKLVWEVLESGLKSKIEIQWSDISYLKAYYPDNLPGNLDIEVSRPPLFFRETNPQPRKHTLWQGASDFTGGQATICKRHSLTFPEGVLNRHYEKLVQCDPRLKALADETLSSRPTPDFDHGSWLFEGSHQRLPGHQQRGHHNGSLDGGSRDLPYIPPHLLSPSAGGLVNHGGTSDSQREVGSMKMQTKDLSSPSSVIDSRAGDDSGASDTEELRFHEDIEFDLQMPFVGAHDITAVKPSDSTLFMPGGEIANSQQHLKLADIRRCLLEEGAFSNEQVTNYAMLGQLNDALAGELSNHCTRVVEGSDAGHSYPLSAMVKNEAGPEDHNWQGSTVAMNGRMGPREPSFNSFLSCFNKNGSASDLLLHIPRVASLPQLFEAASQPPSARYDLPFSRPHYPGSDKLR